MEHTRYFVTAVLLCSALGVSLHSGALRAAGTPGAGGEDLIGAQENAQSAARQYYQAGFESKQAALALEQEAAAAADDQQEALLERAHASWLAAATAQGKALKLDLNDHEAANELGFALRKSGQHRKALGAYNFALTIRPDFYPAIEYRGEAYLALGRLEDAKTAYLILFRNEPDLAARLLAAMESAPIGQEAFQAWVAERKLLAAVTPGAAGEAASW
jgi:tetratricopeptide (TPR) repeat protein